MRLTTTTSPTMAIPPRRQFPHVASSALTKVKGNTNVLLRSIVEENTATSIKKISSAHSTSKKPGPVINTAERNQPAHHQKPIRRHTNGKREKQLLDIVDGKQAKESFSAAVWGSGTMIPTYFLRSGLRSVARDARMSLGKRGRVSVLQDEA